MLRYPAYDFQYTIRAAAKGGDIELSVILDKPLPEELAGRAGFNLELLPAAYFEKTYLMDDRSGTFPLYPSGPMSVAPDGGTDPQPIAVGKRLASLPAGNFSGSGDVLVSQMGKAEVARSAKDQQAQ